jgi:hypothetical protein
MAREANSTPVANPQADTQASAPLRRLLQEMPVGATRDQIELFLKSCTPSNSGGNQS